MVNARRYHRPKAAWEACASVAREEEVVPRRACARQRSRSVLYRSHRTRGEGPAPDDASEAGQHVSDSRQSALQMNERALQRPTVRSHHRGPQGDKKTQKYKKPTPARGHFLCAVQPTAPRSRSQPALTVAGYPSVRPSQRQSPSNSARHPLAYARAPHPRRRWAYRTSLPVS